MLALRFSNNLLLLGNMSFRFLAEPVFPVLFLPARSFSDGFDDETVRPAVHQRYLEWFDRFERTSVEIPTRGCTLDEVRVIHSDFMDWKPDQKYDLVLCLQVLEHVPDASAFALKLLTCGRVVIVSVPYRWPAGSCSEHVHDPVDESKLKAWTERDPVESAVVDSRFVAAYC